MKLKTKVFLIIMFAVVWMAPLAVFAAETDPTPPRDGAKGIENPIKFNNLDDFILGIVDGVTQIGYYLVVIFIIYSGFLFVKARGNETELKKAKEAFLYTVIGAAILLGATVLATVVRGTVNQIRSDSTSGGDTRLLP